VFHDFSTEECRQMFTSTAAELYRFDLDVLTPVAERIGPRIDEVARPLDALPDDSAGAAFWRPNEVQAVLDDASIAGL
jgi:hypothetical protein